MTWKPGATHVLHHVSRSCPAPELFSKSPPAAHAQRRPRRCVAVRERFATRGWPWPTPLGSHPYYVAFQLTNEFYAVPPDLVLDHLATAEVNAAPPPHELHLPLRLSRAVERGGLLIRVSVWDRGHGVYSRPHRGVRSLAPLRRLSGSLHD